MTTDIQLMAQLAGMQDGAVTNYNDPTVLRKALATTAGFLGINLEPQAKWMQPFFAGLRRRLPVNSPKMGAAQAQWRMQLGYGNFAFGSSSSFGSANGAVGPDTIENATTILADYVSQSIKGGVQYEAIVQAEGWDNAMNLDTMTALNLLMRLEELEILYGNRAALTPPVITGNYSTVHALAGPIFSNATWNVKVTAITGQGTLNNANGIAPSGININTGETLVSNTAAIAVGASGADYLDVSWPAVQGALGYKVYASAVGGGATVYLCDPNTTLAYCKPVGVPVNYLGALGDPIVVPSGQNYVTVNHVQITAPPANTQPVIPVADGSANSNMYEGYMSWLTKDTIYGVNLASSAPRLVTDMAGLPLTTQGTGILEFDNLLRQQWVTNHTSPSLILCSSNSIVSMSNKIAAAGNSQQMRLDVYQDRNNIVGGLYIGGYVNKFASSMINMQKTIEVWAHPYVPDGVFLFVSEDVPPETLPYSRVAKTFELDVAIPYTYFELGRVDRSFPYTVFNNQTLKCYWPSAQSAIVGCRVDQ